MKAETAAMIMMSGSADLEDITINENGEYESVDHDGFDVVTVEVETYWDEYQQALQQISDLEDALEDCHDCRDAVVAAIQVYDPEYDPAEGECPAPKVGEIVDHAKDCDDCKAEVVAKLQEYDPDFNPQTCEDIVDKIEEDEDAREDAEEHEGYEFPPKPDGTPQDPDIIIPLIATDPLEDTSSRYVPTFYAALQNTDTHEVTKSNAYAGAFRTEATGRWSGSLGIDIYDKTTKQNVYSSISALSVGGYGLNSVDSGVGLNTMSIDPTTGVISVTFTWYHVWDTRVQDYVDYQYSNTITGLETYFTGYGTGTWKVKNT